MERPIHPSSGPKVSQIANLFQRRPTEIESDSIKEIQSTSPTAVARTESHSTRFNNARALFEKLGVENRAPRPAALSLKMTNSSSREDNLGDCSPDRDNIRTPSPKRNKYPIQNSIANGVPKRDPTKIHNTSRMKSDKPEKPEKPERKFNSKELIEKQKNWTSHFTKARTTKFNSDRCDIIRTVPGTVHYPAIESTDTTRFQPASKSVDQQHQPPPSQQFRSTSPPSPPIRQNLPPEIKPRHSTTVLTTIQTKSITSPTKPPPPIPISKPQQISSPIKCSYADHGLNKTTSPIAANKHDEIPEKRKRSSIDIVEDSSLSENPSSLVEYAQVKKHSISADPNIVSPAHGLSSSPSPAPSASSGPSSPIHTEDEKQENESTEKSEKDDDVFERKYQKNFHLLSKKFLEID